jgi:hypothetical protein
MLTATVLRLRSVALALALAGGALAAIAALPACALASTPIALDAPGNGGPPLVAFDSTTQTTYVAWADPHLPGVDLCILPAGATACEGGAAILLADTSYPGYSSDNRPGLGGLVILPGGDVVVIGTPVSRGSIAWASPAGGAAFLSPTQGLQNGGKFISPVSLFYAFGNAVALSATDVGLLDDYGNFFSDSPFSAESPAIPAENSNPGGQFGRKALATDGPEIAAEAAPAPAPAGSEIVLGVGQNDSSSELTPPGCLNDAATGYGLSVGLVDGTSKAAGTLNHAGLSAYHLLACSAAAPVLAGGGQDGIGVLEEEGSAFSGTGSTDTLDYRPFIATATGGSFGAPVELSDVTGETLNGVNTLDVADDAGTGVYATWSDHQGLVLDYSANGGATWQAPAVVPAPAAGSQGEAVIAGAGAGAAKIAYTSNPGTGTQVFLRSVNYAEVAAAGAVSIAGSGTTNGTTVTITVKCPSLEPCKVTVTITATEVTIVSVARASRKQVRRTKTVTLATGKFTIPGKGSKKLSLHLTKAGRRLLAREHGHLKAKVLVSDKTPGGSKLTTGAVAIKHK